jgi:hypothetical protein
MSTEQRFECVTIAGRGRGGECVVAFVALHWRQR